jgi:Rad3-related DNA helicase
MSAPSLVARVNRRDGVLVSVSLFDAAQTAFVEGSLASVPDSDWILPEAGSDPEGVLETSAGHLTWLGLLAILEPSAWLEHRGRLEELAKVDNRLDLEGGLQAEVEWLHRWAGEWRVASKAEVTSRIQALGRHDARSADLLSGVLTSLPPALSDREVNVDPNGPFAHADGRLPRRPDIDDEEWAAWNAREVEEILGARGGLASLLGESFESRPGQLDMGLRVQQVLQRSEHLMIEAGTGIGKSLAYLVPTLLHAGRSHERVVISTHTKNLQSQLFEKDLPLLSQLGFPGPARLLLGRNNYLCRRQLLRILQDTPRSAWEARAQLSLALWWRQSEEGRREELLDHPLFERFWRQYFESVEPCSPHICHRDPVCFVVRARRVARDAPVVVVNHSLLMMDLKSAQNLMGPARLLVVDEAHHLPGIATHALSHRLAPERLEVYRNLLGDRRGPRERREVLAALARAATATEMLERVDEFTHAADAAVERWLDAFLQWFAAVEAMAAERLGATHERAGSHRYHDAAEAFGPVRAACETLEECGESLYRSLAAVVSLSGDLEAEDLDVEEEREALAALLEFHRDFREQVRFCLQADDEDWVYWFEWGGERGLVAVVAAPLTVEAPLAALWDHHYESVVMTSATLAVETNFLPFAESVGFSQVARFTDSLQVPSPFAHDDQALLLTALDLPEPNDGAFAAAVASVVGQIALRVPTKILVLCTSYRFVDQVTDDLRARVEAARDELFVTGQEALTPEILAQRPGVSRATLVDRFRRAPAAVLVATGAFWEGVDFPGRQLEVLVVPRLPFAVPTEPVTEGRHERARRLGRDPFQDVSLVDAVLRLKQGVGRLLRSHEDRGVVLLLDKRLQTKAYGVTFLKSMPRLCDFVPSLEEAGERSIEFLREGHDRARSGRG